MERASLDWVQPQITESLEHARLSLEDFAEGSGSLDSVSECSAVLHRVRGALEMLELHGLSFLIDEMEALSQGLVEERVTRREEACELLMRSIAQLANYIEYVRVGNRDSPLLLVSLLNDLRSIRGEPLLCESVLFSPELWSELPPPARPGEPSDQAVREESRRLRAFFQKGLVGWFRGAAAPEGIGMVAAVTFRLCDLAASTEGRRLWWVAQAVSHALHHRQLETSAALKRIFGQLDGELKLLAERGVAHLRQRPRAELLRNLLYYAALADPGNQPTQAIRDSFGLDELLVRPDARTDAERALGSAGGDGLQSVAEALKDDIARVKDSLETFVRNEDQPVGDLAPHGETLGRVADTLGLLNLAAPRRAVMEQAEAIGRFRDRDTPPSHEELIAIARVLLGVDNALDSLPAHGLDKVSDAAAQAHWDSAPGSAGLSAIEYLQLLTAVINECKRDLTAVKEGISTFVVEPDEYDRLEEIPDRLSRVQGTLTLLGLERAARILAGWAGFVRATFLARREIPAPETLDLLADTIVGIEYYLEAVAESRRDAEQVLDRVEARAGGLRALDLVLDFDVAQGEARVDAAEDGPGGEEPPLPDIPQALLEDLQRAKDLLARIDDAHDEHPPESTQADAGPPPDPVPAGGAGGIRAEGAGDDGPDAEVFAVFLEEAGELARTLGGHVLRWTVPGDAARLAAIRGCFHTLKGSGRIARADAIAELAWQVENLLNRVVDGGAGVNAAVVQIVQDAAAALPGLIDAARAGGATAQTDALIRRAAEAAAAIAVPVHGEVGVQPVSPAQQAASASILSFPPRHEKDQSAEQAGAPPPGEADPATGPALRTVFAEEAAEHLAALRRLLSDPKGDASLTAGVTHAALTRIFHTLHGSARAASVHQIAELCGALEAYLVELGHTSGGARPLGTLGLALIRDALRSLDGVVRDLRHGTPGPLAGKDALLTRIAVLTDAVAPRPDPSGAPQTERDAQFEQTRVRLRGALRERNSRGLPVSSWEAEQFSEAERSELRAIFLEEAAELLEATDAAFERWRSQPDDLSPVAELQREVHTLKGGARVAGLRPVTDLSHALESLLMLVAERLLEPDHELFELISRAHDVLATQIDQADSRRALAAADPVIEAIDRFLSPGLHPPPAAGSPVAGPAQGDAGDGDVLASLSDRRERVSVSAELLDEVVDRASELSIGQSRVQRLAGQFRLNADEMDQTVRRLRDQLRRLEVETESQILYRYQGADDDNAFDPLELDRFSTIQQLSRALSESASDLASLQLIFDELTRDGEALLAQQARSNNELQQGLLRTRMVPFARQVPRLRRTVRETARELDKAVRIDLRGEETRLDRTISARMQAPLEHMLRNAVDHGIESRAHRLDAGKPEEGRVALALYRDGNEVVIEVSDDGQGMDRDAIRARALQRGMLEPDAAPTDDELLALALRPGFSTAGSLTQISGRGVGLDVVHTEVKQLGGSLNIASTPGAGTRFEVRLPYALALNHALLVVVGSQTFALPVFNVEAVLRLSAEEAARADHSVPPVLEHAGTGYRFSYLSSVLGVATDPRSRKPERFPVVLLRAGEQRLALVVDELQGRHEIMVKPVGRQLAVIPWLAGATILGDGKVVLVLDVSALIRAALSARSAGVVAASPEGGPTVMVVDDSITVRRFTGRFLARNGMRVITAKDGMEALALLQEDVPDLMLLDIEMPRMDGFELVAAIRSDSRLSALPIVMVTSRAGKKHSERARQIGVDRYLGKPFDEARLLETIRGLARDAGEP